MAIKKKMSEDVSRLVYAMVELGNYQTAMLFSRYYCNSRAGPHALDSA